MYIIYNLIYIYIFVPIYIHRCVFVLVLFDNISFSWKIFTKPNHMGNMKPRLFSCLCCWGLRSEQATG